MNISFRNVTKRYEATRRAAVDDVSFEVEDGDVVGFIGTSGAGKSTLIRMINRLVTPTSGEIVIGGRRADDYDLVQLRRTIAFVPQDYGLMSHLTVLQNVELGLRAMGLGRETRRLRASEMLDLVGVPAADFGECGIDEISGGQKQRVALARALALFPTILLLDEPFAALDPLTKRSLTAEILRIWSKRKMTILIVTHDVDEAMRMSSKIGVMRDARLEQFAAPGVLVESPATPFVRAFVDANRASPERLRRIS